MDINQMTIPLGSCSDPTGPRGRSDLAHNGFEQWHIDMLNSVYGHVPTDGIDAVSDVITTIARQANDPSGQQGLATNIIGYMNIVSAECMEHMRTHGANSLQDDVPYGRNEVELQQRRLVVDLSEAGVGRQDARIFHRALDAAIVDNAKARFAAMGESPTGQGTGGKAEGRQHEVG